MVLAGLRLAPVRMIIQWLSGVSTSLPLGFGPKGSTASPPSNLVSHETTFQVPVSCKLASSAYENPGRKTHEPATASARINFMIRLLLAVLVQQPNTRFESTGQRRHMLYHF